MDYDLFVIGAGSGGVRAARIASDLGARVAIAEDLYLGGTCVNVGCVPKKVMWNAATVNEIIHDAKQFGFEVDSYKFNWNTIKEARDKYIIRLK